MSLLFRLEFGVSTVRIDFLPEDDMLIRQRFQGVRCDHRDSGGPCLHLRLRPANCAAEARSGAGHSQDRQDRRAVLASGQRCSIRTTRIWVSLILDLLASGVSVLEEGLSGRSDRTIFDAAAREGRVLITLDHDFGNLIRFPPPDETGTIILEMAPSVSFPLLLDLARLVANELGRRFPRGRLWIVQPGRIRETRVTRIGHGMPMERFLKGRHGCMLRFSLEGCTAIGPLRK